MEPVVGHFLQIQLLIGSGLGQTIAATGLTDGGVRNVTIPAYMGQVFICILIKRGHYRQVSCEEGFVPSRRGVTSWKRFSSFTKADAVSILLVNSSQ